MVKLTRKATTKIIDLVQAIKPGTSKNTSFDEAWDIIANYTDISIEMICDVNDNTFIKLYKGDNEIGRLELKNSFIREKGDWDWNIIYKEIIEYMMKNKFVKKPRLQKKVQSEPNNIYNKKQDPIDPDRKKKKMALYMKIRNWKKKGKDTTELEKEYNML